jgi:hypothetical protein
MRAEMKAKDQTLENVVNEKTEYAKRFDQLEE